MTNFIMPNNTSSMKHALKSVPGLADVGAPHGVGDGPRTQAPGSRSKIYAYHVDQGEKLKGLDAKKVALRPKWPWVQGTDVLFYLDFEMFKILKFLYSNNKFYFVSFDVHEWLNILRNI